MWHNCVKRRIVTVVVGLFASLSKATIHKNSDFGKLYKLSRIYNLGTQVNRSPLKMVEITQNYLMIPKKIKFF